MLDQAAVITIPGASSPTKHEGCSEKQVVELHAIELLVDSFHATVAEAADVGTCATDIVIEELSGGLPRLPKSATTAETTALLRMSSRSSLPNGTLQLLG